MFIICIFYYIKILLLTNELTISITNLNKILTFTNIGY